MNIRHTCVALLLLTSCLALKTSADERRFTYVYEPETLPEGSMEVENWVTLGSGRNSYVGQDHFNQWDLRQEFEYGISDRYTVSFYLNERAERFKDPASSMDQSEFEFRGISLENRYMLVNPVEHPVGLTAYLEGRYAGDEAELEAKLILGQRHGLWKWALNIGAAMEWEDNLSEREGEVEASFGLTRELSSNWALGLEVLSNSILPEYESWENSALFVGPTISYHREKWWTALTVLPQVYGWNSTGAPDGNSHLELLDHEKLNIRWMLGFNF